MNRLEKRFKIERDKTPYYSDIVNLGHVVQYQRFSRPVIERAILSLVDKDDYQSTDYEAVVEHLLSLSHSPKPDKDAET